MTRYLEYLWLFFFLNMISSGDYSLIDQCMYKNLMEKIPIVVYQVQEKYIIKKFP